MNNPFHFSSFLRKSQFNKLSYIAVFTAFLSVSAHAHKSVKEYISYFKSVGDSNVMEIYHTATGAITPVIKEEQEADDIEAGESAKSSLFLASFRSHNEGGINLYSTNIKTGAQVRLNAPLVEGGNVNNWIATPSQKVAFYIADQEVDNRLEIYVTSTKKSKPTKLNASYDDYTDFSSSFLWPLPNGKGLAYTALNSTNGSGIFLSMIKEPIPQQILTTAGDWATWPEMLDMSPRSTGFIIKANVEEQFIYRTYYYDIKQKSLRKIEPPTGTNYLIQKAKFDRSGKNIFFTVLDFDSFKASIYKHDITKNETSLVVGPASETHTGVGLAFQVDSKFKTLYFSDDRDEAGIQIMYSLDLKKNVVTQISESGKQIESSTMDQAGNLWYTTRDNVTYDRNVYRKPAKKGPITHELRSSDYPDMSYFYLTIGEKGLTALLQYYTGIWTNHSLYKSILGGEFFDFQLMVPEGSYPILLDGSTFEYHEPLS